MLIDIKVWTSNNPDVSARRYHQYHQKIGRTSWSLPINDTKCAHMSLGGASGNRFIIHDGATANDILTLGLKKDLSVWITSILSFAPHHISSHSLLYADDLKIWTSDDPNALQEDIINLKNWSISWNLQINDAKCAHMSLGDTPANRFIIHDCIKASELPRSTSRKIWVFGLHPTSLSNLVTLWPQTF